MCSSILGPTEGTQKVVGSLGATVEVLGIDIGGSGIKGAIVDVETRVL